MMRINGLCCCGALEIVNVGSIATAAEPMKGAEDGLWSLCQSYDPAAPRFPQGRYYIFTQAGVDEPDRYGRVFAQFIRDNNLGEVFEVPGAGKNPNSGNHLVMWIWIADLEAMKAWVKAQWKARDYKWEPAKEGAVAATVPSPDTPFPRAYGHSPIITNQMLQTLREASRGTNNRG